MLLPSRIPAKTFQNARPDFDIEQFRKVVLQKGLDLEWEQTMHCPCYVPSGEAGLDLMNVVDEEHDINTNPNCPVCHGEGLIRHSTQTIKVLVTEASGEFDTKQYGTSNNAEIKLTLLPEHLPSFGDRFKLTNSVIVRNELIEYTGVNTLSLSYPIINRALDLSTGITSVGILSIWLTDANGLTQQEVDLSTVNVVNGQLEFTGVTPGVDLPIVDTKFAVQYFANPVYVVKDHPHTIRDTYVRIKGVEKFNSMPVQCLARLENK